MLMSKVKLEELRQNLYRSIDNTSYVPYQFDFTRWAPNQYNDLDQFKSMLQSQSKIQMREIVDQILDAIYCQEDMEKDLKLT